MKPRDIIKRMKDDEWYEVDQVGSHKQFKHDEKPGRVTIPDHNKDSQTENSRLDPEASWSQMRPAPPLSEGVAHARSVYVSSDF